MDKDQKVIQVQEIAGVGHDVAQHVLAAVNWDVEAAVNTLISGDAPSAPQQSAPCPAAQLAQQQLDNDSVRPAMRTGYMDTLVAPTEQEAKRLEQEQLRRLAEEQEEQRLAAERAREAENEAAAARYRKEAEQKAFERRRQQLAGGQRESTSSTCEEPTSESQARTKADGANFFTAVEPQENARTEGDKVPSAQAELRAQQREAKEAEDLKREKAEAEARQKAAERSACPQEKKKQDEVVESLVALRQRYKTEDPVALATCLKTLKAYISNLARQPHEPKFQRINCDNNVFRSRVAALDGAVAVLNACGFKQEETFLVIEAESARSKSAKLWDALAKIDVMVDQLKVPP